MLARYRNAVLGALLIQLSISGLLLAQSSSPLIHEGHVDAGNGVRLFYRLLGTGRDTIVIIHGGPGFSSAYFGTISMPWLGLGGGTRCSSTINAGPASPRWSRILSG